MQQHKKIECLMLFVEIAQQLSFSKAAENLSISNGYLSDQIKKLEKEFKCPLLVRTTRSVRLTPQGKKVLAQGQEIKAAMLNLERNIYDEHSALQGVIKITAPKMFTECILLNICYEFQQTHPAITFEIDSSYTNHDLIKDDFDLAFRATLHPPENMVAKELFSYQHCLCAAPEYFTEHGKPETVMELADHQCLSALEQPFWPLKSGDIAIAGWLSINENHLLKQMAVAGKGIIRIADYYVMKELQQGKLTRVLTDQYIQGQSIYILYPQLIYPSAKISAFTAFVQDKINRFKKII
ncbi:LysR family transcriptional regulator [Psychromonas antarctica]|uniref:LysR family transcriptional regulator n=1 Tax=Psychromonas antarctica TaxID=67573 RepID=UPI001EE91779|nr:LysR family transcriptional regulator [Psychromonas antarctica]MCG6201468.1 LysR family transcriptional regulator [Psychromonas antarctica]